MAETRDQSWQIAQEKAFTAWMNETLAQRSMRVTNLRVDLPDGFKLASFLEILSGKKIQTKIDAKPASRIQKIQNLHIALTFLEKEMELKNPGCSAEDVVDADSKGIKLVLGLLWTLYRKYRIAVITHKDKSSEEGLLLWCKNITDGYNGVNIENFKTSFNDGLAFLAMIHRFNPEKTEVAYDSFSKANPEHNLTAAFDLAEKEMGIPKLLDVKDVMDGKVDERSLVLYTSLFFHAFRASAVANDLAQAKASTEETLASEKRKNEELRSQNAKLEEKITQLTLEMEAQARKNEELTKKNRQLEEQIAQLQSNSTSQLSDERKKIQALEDEINKLKNELKKKDEAYQQLLKEKEHLEKELQDTKTKLQLEIEKGQERERVFAKRQAEDEQQINDLKKKLGVFEEEVEGLKNDIEGFKIQLDNERKDNVEQRRLMDEKRSQDGVHFKGLQVLRRNLDQHIEDLHTWQKYLDTKEKNFLDFDREIRPGVEGEINERDFIEQLNILSGKLDVENEAMLKLLKTKMAEAKKAELDAKKGEVKK
jgi:cortexillin 1/2